MRILRERGSAPLFVVMMAGALGVLIAYGLAKLTSASGLLAKSAAFDGDIDRLEREITAVLANAKACPDAFRDASDVKVAANPAAVPVTVARIYSGFGTGRAIAKLDTRTTASGLVITQMELIRPVLIQGNTWDFTLEMKLEKILENGPGANDQVYLPGAAVITKRFRIAASLGAGNVIDACSPLGSRLALGPMSPIRSTYTVVPTNQCNSDADKDTHCGTLTPPPVAGLPNYPQTYFAATQGDALLYGMLVASGVGGAVGLPSMGLRGINVPLVGHGGTTPWTRLDQLAANGPCTVLCINKEAPMRFSRNTVNANANDSGAAPSKDATCKADFGPRYIAASFNDFAQAGWSQTDAGLAGTIAPYLATIAGHSGVVRFGVDATNSRLMDFTAAASPQPVACIHLR